MAISTCIDEANQMIVSLAHNRLGLKKVNMYIWDLNGVLIDHKILNLNDKNESGIIALDHVEKQKKHLLFISSVDGHYSQLINLN